MDKEKNDSIVYCIACVVVLLLFVSRYILIGASIIVLLIGYLLFRQKRLKVQKICLFFLIFCIYNIIQYLFISNGKAIQEIERNILYLLVVVLLINIKVSYVSFIKIWRGMLLFCFAIQIIQFLKLFNINAILENIYGYNMFLKQAGYSSIAYFRSGSIFISINPYFKFTAASIAISFYDLNREDGNRVIDYICIGIAFVSSLLSGSRTGYVIIAFISMIYVISTIGSKVTAKSVLRVALAAAGFLIAFVVLNQRFNLLDARFFNTDSTGSLDYKIILIKKFLSSANTGEFFFGMGAYDASTSELVMDADLGYALSYYGLIGVIIYYSMMFNLIDFGRYYAKREKIYLFMLLTTIVLSGITSGVYFNYRVFSIILLAVIPIHTSFANGRMAYQNEVGDK